MDVTLSVVSHGQNSLVNQLLADLQAHCDPLPRLVLTQNIADTVPLTLGGMAADVITNERPKGFGANHNAAFLRCRTQYFCVANPDVRLISDPFPPLADCLRSTSAAAVGPLVRSPAGNIEDSARRFPTVGSLLRKLLRGKPGPDYPSDQGVVDVDWIAGMFMLFQADAYRKIGGFDERFFLYYEDVDLCRRLTHSRRKVVYEPQSEVLHAAQRTSRRSPQYFRWHAASLFRYLLSR